jgi:spore germination protein YaaH
MKRTVNIILLCMVTVIPAFARPFPEVWAYLMKGEESHFPASSPITDVGCFSASVDGDGNLSGGHLAPPSLAGNHRYHLVITIPWNSTLAHIYLNPELPFRERIIAGIVERSKPFDGVQIDFEGISKEDGTNYLNFLTAVKKALPKNKIFSVAVMARWAEHKRMNPSDAFDYPFINLIADRIIVMAYDEHYRGGTPGPVASLPWCEKIYDYACATIDPGKLVMGIPLYGRSWQKEKTARAWRNPEIWTDLRRHQADLQSSPETGGTYSYRTNVSVEVHFETLASLDAKMQLYASRPIRGIAFWRISQEPLNFWEHLSK